MEYPADRFDVHVVADHCEDGTARVARAAGAIVHERQSGPRGRKGYALEWLLRRLLDHPAHYDAIVVFDADSRVAPQFLDVINRAFSTASANVQVVQGRHVIANPQASAFSTLADADMRLNNRIRNQAKENLGLSARLMGDAMCFRREVLEAYPWVGSDSLTEDREYGIYLLTQGVRVHFASEAISLGQATSRWRDATGQRLRWTGGASQLRKRYLRRLLATAWRQRNLDALDRALELALPPFSWLCLMPLGLALLQLALGAAGGLVGAFHEGVWWAQGLVALRDGTQRTLSASVFLAATAFVYPFIGLLAERAPLRNLAIALIYGPVYAAWRVWLVLVVRSRQGRVQWIRTRRAEEMELIQ
jgi:cellulose synthase/poly-beta-1,6-N-acetylglucosamine synthase-like glycosyltransferase